MITGSLACRLVLTLALLGIGTGVLACAPAASAPATRPAPAGGEVAAATADADWEQVAVAAKREGRISLNGPASAEAREALTEGFQRKYPEIQVDYTGSSGSAVPPKLFAEREAGQFRADLIVNGTTTQLDLIRGNAMDPIAPYLVGPNARDTSRWQDGKLAFADNAETYNVVYGCTVKTPIVYNPGQVSPEEIRSYKDLLQPKWKGKMAMYDPRAAGTGLSYATFFYTHEELGKEFLRQLLGQNLVLSRDERQLLDWVVRGQYALVIAPAERMLTDFRSKGVPVHLLGAESIKEGTYVAAGTSTVGVVNRAPHPNAVRLYLDYLLSRDGQLEWSKGGGFVSRRTDVPTDYLPDYVLPKPGVRYQEDWKEDSVDLKDEVAEFIRAVTGS
jgi:iron(III) transport system substrate-binding protein